MIYLVIAILFGSLFAILFKLFQQHGIDSLQAIGVNYVVAAAIGVVGSVAQEAQVVALGSWAPWALVAGLFMMAGFVTMNYATRWHGVAVSTIAARVAFVVPVLCAYLFLGSDEPQWLASVLVIVSLFLIFPSRGVVSSVSQRWFLPLLVFLSYGVANFMLKYCQQLVAQAGGSDADLSLVSAFAFVAAIVFTMIYYFSLPSSQRQPFAWRNVWAGLVLGIVNMGCTYFLLKSLMVIDSAIFYPIYNISIVLIASVVGRWYFGERLSIQQYVGIIIALAAIVLFFK